MLRSFGQLLLSFLKLVTISTIRIYVSPKKTEISCSYSDPRDQKVFVPLNLVLAALKRETQTGISALFSWPSEKLGYPRDLFIGQKQII